MKFQQWEPDLITLVSRINDDEIDLQPDFQRQEVWTPQKRRKLIDTVLRQWSMPPVHLIDSPDGTLEVLDGQQRLATIRDFVNNRFRVDGYITPHSNDLHQLDKLYYRNLPIRVRRDFDRYPIRAFRLSDFSPEEPSELFYRLNQATSLTAGEQRNSLYGNARNQLKEMVQSFQQRNSRENIGFSNARLAYDDVLARLLFFLDANNIAIKANESQISDMFRRQEGFSEATYARARTAVERFSEARAEAGRIKLNKASLLSWLLFYSRGECVRQKVHYMSVFLELRPEVNSSIVDSARDLFADRASGRVTDVSSVFLRDFCLWLAYYDVYECDGPSRYANLILNEVHQFQQTRSDATLEECIDNFVDVSQWSDL